MPKIAINTAPPAMKSVATIIQDVSCSPRINLAKKAFHKSETAPRGAKITTGREAICTREPRTLEDMNIEKPRIHKL